MTYTYDPHKIKGRGKDQMRFELGDTLVDGGAETCALADEEYAGILYYEDEESGIKYTLKPGRKAWLFAKLYVLEAIMFKLSYQVDTKIDALSYGLGKRAEHWKNLYEMIRQQILASFGLPFMNAKAQHKPPYFHTGMNENWRAKIAYTPYSPFRRMVK